jgi:hypothetical protein
MNYKNLHPAAQTLYPPLWQYPVPREGEADPSLVITLPSAATHVFFILKPSTKIFSSAIARFVSSKNGYKICRSAKRLQ